ncbi:transposase [Mycoplasmopsis pullorum]|uniref:Uncharacterized protein n=1 Tax=Mycoplasmopsis pullorum TaxID=48003 RepID=A0A1L4FSE6_9BACT|nr:transposase [Mycoplasmopsis pullorum]APJ38512.1 hypothetical protein BLA55_02480 [Mycoplasmopsis pullorum]
MVKEKFLNNDVILYQYYEKHIGFQLVCDFLNHFDIFNDPEQLKLNNINTAMKNQINLFVQKQINFSNRSKIPQIHNNKTDSYLSLFKLFDYLFKNKDEILRRLNTFLANKQKSQLNIFWYETQVTDFQTFSEPIIEKLNFEENFSYNQENKIIVVATNENNIPVNYKIFDRTSYSFNDLMYFISQTQEIFKIQDVTIVGDRKLLKPENIKLVQEKGWNYILSYRLNFANEEFKNSILNTVNLEKLLKLNKVRRIFTSELMKNERGILSRKIVAFLPLQIQKNREFRKKIIDNYCKNLENTNFDLTKNNNELTLIEQDKKCDGLYVYESNIKDVDDLKIAYWYSRKNQAKDDLIFFELNLLLKPNYFENLNQIDGFVLLCLLNSFFFKFLTFKVNEVMKFTRKEKFTEERLFNIVTNVKQIDELFDDKLERVIDWENQDIKQSWKDYYLLQNVLNKLKSES